LKRFAGEERHVDQLGGERMGQGRENARVFLKENKDIRDKLETALRKKLEIPCCYPSATSSGVNGHAAAPASTDRPPQKAAAAAASSADANARLDRRKSYLRETCNANGTIPFRNNRSSRLCIRPDSNRSSAPRAKMASTCLAIADFRSLVFVEEEYVDNDEDGADGDCGVGDVEGGPMVAAEPDFEEVCDRTVDDAIGYIAGGPAQQERETGCR